MYRTDVEFEFKFVVKNVSYRNDAERFKIVRAKIISHTYPETLHSTELTVQGIMPSAMKGDTFKAIGRFKIHETYGASIHLKGYPVATLPQVKKGIIEFIKKRVKGLGIKTSKLIVDTLGLEAISLIEQDYKCLLGIKGLSEKRAISIHEKISEHRKFEDLALFIQANAIEYPVALNIYEEFKSNSIVKIKENPYSIAFIPKVDFQHADKIAYNLGFPYANYERIKSAVLHYINYHLQTYGDICVFKSELINRFDEFLIKLGEYPEENSEAIDKSVIQSAITELVTQNLIVIEQNLLGADCIYRKDYNVIENQIISNLTKLLSNDKPAFCSKNDIEPFLLEYEANELKLADEQRNAVYMSLLNGISILTGGPGTGKTQTTNAIVKCIKYLKPTAEISLLAPTGKASRRMTQLTSMEAFTIHKGVGLNAFNSNRDLEQIESDFVIVDEASMVDAYVFNVLISNISDNTRIILVGDYEQLPSVGAGLILRDLINSEKIPVTKLTKIFRQAQDSQIVMNAHHIIKGNKEDLTFDNSKKDFYFINSENKISIKNKILQSIENMIKNQGYSLSDVVVLSPTRKGELGTHELNRAIQMKFNPSSNNPEYWVDSLNCFRVGDIVMQTVNNYDSDINVMNGDMGVIERIYTDEGQYIIEVNYPGKNHVVEYKESLIHEMQLAYALTIHKSQGSEFPVVITPVHKEHYRMLNKNLIYTGITRAKQTMVLIGSMHTFYTTIDKADDSRRISRIKEKLQNIATNTSVA